MELFMETIDALCKESIWTGNGQNHVELFNQQYFTSNRWSRGCKM